ncbi:MAG: hypothetical protein KDA89_22140 [Planctomycetaceae bacterium]|nr:hypothetical protein [Planctomycetaceae bacterium]
MNDYSAFGIRFQSEISLPGLRKRDPGQQPDVAIRFGEVPETLENVTYRGHAWMAAPGVLLLNRPEAGRFLVRDGREIVIQPRHGVSEAVVQVFLQGSAFGALLHQRGIFPLHAGVVQVGNDCVAFTGHSGAGKSTFTAALHQAGYPVISDDVAAIQCSANTAPVVFSGRSVVKLNSDSLTAVAGNDHGLAEPQSELEKFELPVTSVSERHGISLRAVYELHPADHSDEECIVGYPNAKGLMCLSRHTYRRRYEIGLGMSQQHFLTRGRILQSVGVFGFHRVRDLKQLSRHVRRLEQHWQSLAEPRRTKRAA